MKSTVKRIGLVATIFILSPLVCYVLSHIYLAHEVTRASTLLGDMQSLELGDEESSAVALSEKYGGYRWVPTSSGNLYEQPEYEYVLQIDPWRFNVAADAPSTLDRAIRRASNEISPGLRRSIGFRRWSATGHIGMRQHRIIAVTATAFVEGSDEWLGGTWHLSATIPEYEVERFVTLPRVSGAEKDRYVIGMTRLNFSKADGGGEAVDTWFTPSATQEERHSILHFVFGCMTSTLGCRTVCDFVPAASEYARTRTWAEGRAVCASPRTYSYP